MLMVMCAALVRNSIRSVTVKMKMRGAVAVPVLVEMNAVAP